MEDKLSDLAEKEFLNLKKTASTEEWSSVKYIRLLAKEHESENIALSLKLMEHALTLRPNGKQIKNLIDFYQKQLDLKLKKPVNTITTDKKSNIREINSKTFQTNFIFTPIFLIVILPWLCFLIYQTLIASPRYQSQAQLIIQQPDGVSTMDPSMALLSGLGVASTNSDTELVRAYMYSNDMLEYLDSKLNLKEHFSDNNNDYFSRLNSEASQEDFLEFYLDHVVVEINEKSLVISVYVQGFDPLFALQLCQVLVDRAEWFINEIGHQLANEQLKFIQNEHELVESKLRMAQTSLLGFQQTYGLLDPEAEGAAMQQITYSIEGQVASKKAELRALLGVMSEDAPQVMALKNQVIALEEQLLNERGRLSANENESRSVSSVLAKFTDLKVDMELALKAFTSSQISLEKARIEAYRQLKYLVVVESPTQPEENKYPKVIYNITLFGVVILLFYFIGKIVVATIKELD